MITTKLSYGSVAVEYGHWASDTDNYLDRFLPEYCSNEVSISNMKINP